LMVIEHLAYCTKKPGCLGLKENITQG